MCISPLRNPVRAFNLSHANRIVLVMDDSLFIVFSLNDDFRIFSEETKCS